jgi:ribose transport system substrate-binding protein
MISRRLALGAALAGLAGCQRERRPTIAVIPKGRAHLFWQSVHAGAAKAAREHNVEIIWNGPPTETDFNGQLQIVEAMINRRVDAIVLAPIDKKAMVGVVERAAAQNIPVIIFDSGIDTDKFVTQVATDNYKAGQLAADRMAQILGGKGEVAILAVQVGAASTMAREAGFEDAVRQKYPGIQIVDKRYGEADFAKSLRAAENILTAHPELDGLFASNESSTVGAAQALKQRGGKVKLVGFDSSPALEADLRAGIIDSLIVQHPFRMGYEAVTAAVRTLRGEKMAKIQDLPPRLVTAADLDKPEVQEQLHPDIRKYLG